MLITMHVGRLAAIVLVACALAGGSVVFGQEAPASGAPSDEVHQLQAELAEMRAELDTMKRAMQAWSVNSGPGPMTDQHLRGMMGRCGIGRMGGGGMSSAELAAPSKPQVDVLTDLQENQTLHHLSQEKKTDVEMAGEKSFDRVCSQCHALPSPELHAASDWPLIVNRMRENMFRMRKPVPDEATTEEIAAFLSANAR